MTIVQPAAAWQEHLLRVATAASLMISQLHRHTPHGWLLGGAGAAAARPGAAAEEELSGARGDLSITGSGCSLTPKPARRRRKKEEEEKEEGRNIIIGK